MSKFHLADDDASTPSAEAPNPTTKQAPSVEGEAEAANGASAHPTHAVPRPQAGVGSTNSATSFRLPEPPSPDQLRPDASVRSAPTSAPVATPGPATARPAQARSTSHQNAAPASEARGGGGASHALPIVLEEARPDQGPSAAVIAASGPSDGFGTRMQEMGARLKSSLGLLEGPATWALRMAVPIAALCLAYLVAAALGGGVANLENNPNRADILRNLSWIALTLKFALMVSGVSILLLSFDDNRTGAFVAAVGVALFFGVPLALRAAIGENAATAVLAREIQAAGFWLLVIGLTRALFDLAALLWSLPDRMKARHGSVGAARTVEAKQRIIAREANMFSPCWKLPFCREAIRVRCPAFLARKTCWKFGRGCYCDEEMIARIVRNEPIELIKAPTRMSQTKPPCGRCYIYLEHQTYKFRMISPLVLPATVALCFFAWPFYAQIFGAARGIFDSLWIGMSFNPRALTPDAIAASSEHVEALASYGTNPDQVAIVAQNMLGFMLGFFLLIYLSRFVEWAIYKVKW